MKKINIPFWAEILVILLIGALASCIVFLIITNKFQNNPEENVPKHTVTFAYLDGTIIETKEVEEGKGVFPPGLKNDGVFRGWSAGFNDIKTNIEVHPVFYNIKENNLFYFNSVYVKEGMNFTLNLYVDGKVNVSSGTIVLIYDLNVLEYKKADGFVNLNVTEDKLGELTITFDCNEPLKEKTLLSKLTFYAKHKDAYSTQISLTANNMKIITNGKAQTTDCATINNKIYFLQEVSE